MSTPCTINNIVDHQKNGVLLEADDANNQVLLCDEVWDMSPIMASSSFSSNYNNDGSLYVHAHAPNFGNHSITKQDCEHSLATWLCKERKFMTGPGYIIFLESNTFVGACRFKAIQWFIHSQRRFNICMGTVFKAVNHVDRFIETNQCNGWGYWMMELLSLASLSIAIKFGQTCPPSLHEIQDGLEFCFEASLIQKMEFKILRSLGWELNSITPHSYVKLITWELSSVMKPFVLDNLSSRLNDVLLVSSLDVNLLVYRPSVLAMSGVRCILEDEKMSFLHRLLHSTRSTNIFELQQVTFIAADNGTRLVTCGSLFVHLTVNVSPLASKLPSRYLPFLKILKKLGVEDMLSITSAMNILSSLQKSGRDFHLNPNELHAVIELLHFLCNENSKQKISEISNGELRLVVPDTDCRLVYHKTCVYVDPHGSRYVKFIDISKLRFVHHSVSERLCLAFGIRKLSDVVVEELDHAGHLQTLDSIGSTSLAAIKRKLLNRSFQVAVSSLLNSVLSSTSGSKTPDFLALQRSLESVAQRLKFVRCIYTRFWLLPKRLDITLASKEDITSELKTGPSQQALFYVDRSKTCMLIAKPPSYVSVPDLVALLVSQVLGSPVPLSIGSLFLCSQDSESALLDILILSSHESVIDGVGYSIGFLGRDIVLGDAKKRQIDPLRAYYQGEIVAWQSQSGEKLKYGRISEDVRPLVGQTLYSLNVETFLGKTETFISSHVFPFQNFPVGREYPTYVRPGGSMHFEQPDESQSSV